MALLNHPVKYWQRLITTLALVTVAVLLMLSVQPTDVTRAQSGTQTCSQILPEVQKRLVSCSAMDRDQVCYGNPSVTATFADSATVSFSKVGDTADLTALKSLQTAPLNLERNEWGIAALRVQVNNLDGTTNGQAATFALFGDTTLTNATPSDSQSTTKAVPPPACSASTSRLSNLRNAPVNGAQSVKVLPANTTLNVSGRIADSSWLFADTQGQTGWVLASSVNLSCDVASRPVIDPAVPAVMTGLRAFYFTTGVSTQAQCRDVPQGGFLVRGPSGRKVQFSVNGTDITMGSTVEFLTVNGKLTITVLQGAIEVTVDGQTVTVKAGQQLSVTVTGNPPQAVGPLPDPQPANNPATRALLCAIDPVVGGGCTQTNPGSPSNPTVVTVDEDPVLAPDSVQGVVIGPVKPPPPQPAAPSGPNLP